MMIAEGFPDDAALKFHSRRSIRQT